MADLRPMVDRIEWSEGMLLSPQHFQQQSARLDSLVAWHTLAVSPFGWGVRKLEFALLTLPSGILRVAELQAIMPDGTAVSFSAENPMHGSLELNLAPFADELAAGTLNIYLTLAVSRSLRNKGAAARFRTVPGDLVEDEITEAVPADLSWLLPELKLQAGPVPSGQYVHFRLATLYRQNEVLKMGDELPPSLELVPEGALLRRVNEFVRKLRSTAAFVAKQTAVPSSKAEDRLAYLEQKDRLRNLLSGLPGIEAVLRTPALHPYALYLSLCSLLGPLSLLRPGALPPLPPAYDHANPSGSLDALLGSLQDALLEVSQEYREVKFEFRHQAFELVLQADWIDKRLVVGLRGQPEKDLVAWMDGAIIGSQSAYASLRERRVHGATRALIESADELGVRSSTGYTLFAIQTNPVLTMPGQPLIISNSTESAAAQRPHELVLFVKG